MTKVLLLRKLLRQKAEKQIFMYKLKQLMVVLMAEVRLLVKMISKMAFGLLVALM